MKNDITPLKLIFEKQADETPEYKTVLVFGDGQDRVIETAGFMPGNKAFEVGYYNGVSKTKAIINISSALGCPVGCNFCELTENGRNLSAREMVAQITYMSDIAHKIDGLDLSRQPLKVNIAKTGDPLFNENIPEMMRIGQNDFPGISFKYSTSLPDIKYLTQRIEDVARFAASYKEGSVQLQISLISTDEQFRLQSTKARLAPFHKVRQAVEAWRVANPDGRTPNCSLLVGEETPCDPSGIKDVLPPDLIRLRIRKIISTEHSKNSGIHEAGSLKINDILRRFRNSGYDISDAGLPTSTEEQHNLASNVTRAALMGGKHKEGILFVSPETGPEPFFR